MPILVLQTGNSHNISNFPSGEVLIQATVPDIQKKRNSDYIILDAGDKRVLLQTSDSLNILPADTIILRGELKMPQPPRNHGEFNYGSYLRSQDIQAVIHRNFSVIAHKQNSHTLGGGKCMAALCYLYFVLYYLLTNNSKVPL